MRSKLLFWLAVAMAVTGMYSPDGNLFFFLAVHSSMLTIGFVLHRREKGGRKALMASASSAKRAPSAIQTKPA